MRKMKRWAALLCAVLMAVTLWPMQAWAAETDGGSAAVTEDRLVSVPPSYSYTFINPLLPPSGDDIALFSNGTDYAVLASDVGFPFFDTMQEAADYARSEFKKHDYLAAFMEIPVDFETIPQEQWDTVCKEIGSQIFEEMIRHDPQDPTGGDYLLYHCYGIRCFASTPKEGICRVVLQTGDFLSSMAQENEATKEADIIIKDLHLNGLSDHEKIRAIYAWLCENVSYDNSTPANETEMLLQHSAYAALVKHTAVCQGYATAFYRLALMAGLNARVVTGTGAGEPHGWNIVKIDGKWYYVDATWDDPVYNGSDDPYSPYHSYFNITTAMLQEDHTPSDIPYNVPLENCTATDAFYYKVNDTIVSTTDSGLVEKVAELLQRNGGRVYLYVTDNDPAEAINMWYNDNIHAICTAIQAETCAFGTSSFGREIVLWFAGEFLSKTPGELNGSSGIDIRDVELLYQYLTTGRPTITSVMTEAQFLDNADVNRDTIIDVYDLQLLYETVCNG